MIEDPAGDGHESFGVWLLRQKDRSGWVGDLAQAAKADPKFLKRPIYASHCHSQ